MTTGPRVGSSSVACKTPEGVMTSMAFGTALGLKVQMGALLPEAQTPKLNAPGLVVNARAWSGLKPSWPVSTTVKPQPEAGVPNCASGSATVIVRSAWTGSAEAVPTLAPEASFQTGATNPCTSTRWLHAPDGAIV